MADLIIPIKEIAITAGSALASLAKAAGIARIPEACDLLATLADIAFDQGIAASPSPKRRFNAPAKRATPPTSPSSLRATSCCWGSPHLDPML